MIELTEEKKASRDDQKIEKSFRASRRRQNREHNYQRSTQQQLSIRC